MIEGIDYPALAVSLLARHARLLAQLAPRVAAEQLAGFQADLAALVDGLSLDDTTDRGETTLAQVRAFQPEPAPGAQRLVRLVPLEATMQPSPAHTTAWVSPDLAGVIVLSVPPEYLMQQERLQAVEELRGHLAQQSGKAVILLPNTIGLMKLVEAR